VRSDRWLPNPETSSALACELLAGAAIPCYPKAPPVWFDLCQDIPDAPDWTDETAEPPAWTCLRPPASECPVRPPVPCRGAQGYATPGQTIIRATGTDLVLNGASLWDPWDHDELVLIYPMDGRDHFEVLQ
jgi:hypothetical protein